MRRVVLAGVLVLFGAVNATARSLEAIRQRGALTLCAHPNALPYASKRDAVTDECERGPGPRCPKIR